MNMKLSENIRKYRRAEGLTQEVLAEALGVTVGAVYKWESGRSTPEIGLITELADLFEISVDVLLGYEVRNNDRAHIVERLHAYCHEPDLPGVVTEAEKALKKYPNDFNIVYWAATLLLTRGWRKREEKLLRRSLELLDRACLLFDQNTDENISVADIKTNMADIWFFLGDTEQAVALLKANNPMRVNSSAIGCILAESGKDEQALPYLSSAVPFLARMQCILVDGYLNYYEHKKDWAGMLAVLNWLFSSYHALTYPDKRCFLHKEEAVFLATQAYVYIRLNDVEQARTALREARRLALWFDEAPCYDTANVRFVTLDKRTTAHDNLGDTALQAVARGVEERKCEALSRLWKELEDE